MRKIRRCVGGTGGERGALRLCQGGFGAVRAFRVVAWEIKERTGNGGTSDGRKFDNLADVLGVELQEEHRDDEFNGWYFYSFSYDGVRIMQASEERLEIYGQA